MGAANPFKNRSSKKKGVGELTESLYGNQLQDARNLEAELQGADIPTALKKQYLKQLTQDVQKDFTIGGGIVPSSTTTLDLSYNIDLTGDIQEKLKKLKKTTEMSKKFEEKYLTARKDQPGQMQSLLTANNSTLLGNR